MLKTGKKILCTLLVVVMCLTSAPLSGFVGIEMFDFSERFADKASAIGELETSGQCGDNAYWDLNIDNGELVVSGNGSMWDYTNNGDWVFNSPLSNRSDIKKVVIGDNITKIGDMSFVGSTNIETVIIGNSVKTIGMLAFWMCDKLENLTLGKNIEVIDYGAFYGCASLKNFSLPNSLITIGDMAFDHCTSLTQVIIPEGTTEVGNSAFSGCENVVNISLPKTLNKIGNGAFLFSVDYFTPEKFENGVFYIDSYLIFANKETGAYCEIKSGTTLIADGAFEYSNVLQSVTIPESVKYIGDNAFDSSTIQEVYIPRNVEKIGNQAFNECESLKRIIVSSENKYYSSDDYGILYDKKKTELITFPLGCGLMEITIPESVIIIKDYAFDESNIRNIIFGSNVTTIGKYAFSWCDNITEIIIPSNVTTIDNGAFSYCDWLKSVVIPDSVTYLGDNAFSNCERLASAKLGIGITNLKDQLFERCINLVDINIPETITKIESGAFDGCKLLKNITLPQGLKSIGYAAFEGTAIEKIVIPESVELIDGHAFSGCNSLADIVIESNYIDLETYSITSCAYTNNKDNWSDGALYIGTILLDIKNDLEFDSFEIRNGTTCLAKSVFNTSHCDKLVEVSIPNSLKIISEQAFLYCNNITDIYYDGTLEEWNSIEVRSGNAVLGKATIHFNDGTTLSHTHNFVFVETFLCLDIYQCVCGETTYTCRHMDDDGNKICDVCQETIVPEHTCEYVEEITKEPTCVTKGEKTFTCDCGNSYTEEVAIDPNNHAGNTRVENYVAPTCVSGYSGDVYCADCGVKLETGKTLPATDEHKYQEKLTKKANCKEEGEITYTCTCGDEYTVTVPKTDHKDRNLDDYCDDCNKNLNVDDRDIIKNGQCGDNVYYTLYSDGELMISGTGPMWDYDYFTKKSPFTDNTDIKNIVIDNNITSVGNYMFLCCENVINVTIGDGIIVIGAFAFSGCESLESIDMGNNVITINEYAFNYCVNLKSIVIPESVVSIGEGAFCYCLSFTSIVIPNSVTTIDKYAFYYCEELENITLGEGVKSIGDETFDCCFKLKHIVIPESVIFIGTRVFQSCYDLENIVVNERNLYFSSDEYGVLFDKNKTKLIEYPRGNKRDSYSIPDSVITIEEGAFISCHNLVNITTGNNITSIGNEAFEECRNLKSFIIPESVRTIGDKAFFCCESLIEINIPNGITSIENETFYGCEALTEVTIPNSVVTIGDNAFSDCNSITNVTIGKGVTDIGNEVFSSCDSLTNIVIPKNVANIGYCVFSTCDSLSSIVVEEGNKNYSNDSYGALFNKDKTVLFQYPIGNSRKSYSIPDSVKTIDAAAFSFCNELTDVVIGKGVTFIGNDAFCSCSGLTSITIPGNVTTIYWGAFSSCDNLVSVIFENGVKTIGDGAFNSCTSLESITLSDSVTDIEEGAFYYCYNITDVYFYGSEGQWSSIDIDRDNKDLIEANIHFLAEDDDHIHSYTETVIKASTCLTKGEKKLICFCGKNYTENIPVKPHIDNDGNGYCDYCKRKMPDINREKVATGECGDKGDNVIWTLYEDGEIVISGIGDMYDRDGDWDGPPEYSPEFDWEVYTAVIEEGVTSIGDLAFIFFEDLKSIEIAESVTKIGEFAFRDCKSLTSITIPGNVETIGMYAFDMCDNLTDVYFLGTKEQWNNNVSIDEYNEPLLNANIHFLGEDDECKHIPETITVPSTCTTPGMQYDICLECGMTLGNAIVLPAAHTPGDWEVVTEPNYEADGKKVIKCTVCGEILEEANIPKLEKVIVKDDDTGVAIEFEGDRYNGEVDIIVEESFDGKAFQLINTETGATKTAVYDIKMTVDGVTTQPNGKLTVKIPLPEGYNANRCFIYYLNTETSTSEKIATRYENGYLIFETDHFSYYAVVEVPDTGNCSCKCHKTGFFAKIIWKITIFFNKLLRRNKVCPCGIYHY